MNQIKVLILDENITYRDLFSQMLKDEKDIIVVATASNRKIGIDRFHQFNPDVIVLSNTIEDIIQVKDLAQKFHTISPDIGIIITTNQHNAHDALEAKKTMEMNVFDFIVKPNYSTEKGAMETLQRKLIGKIRCFSIEHFSKIAICNNVNASKNVKKTLPVQPKKAKKECVNITHKFKFNKYDAIVIGVSTGGPQALNKLIPSFPSSFQIPILIALHMPNTFTGMLADEINKKSNLPVLEVTDNSELKEGAVYLARGGLHLIVEKCTRNRVMLRTLDTSPVNGCKPSVDILFQSAATIFKDRVIGVILTGMGNDGSQGVKNLKEYNAPVIVQDQETSVVWGMPGNAVSACSVDSILPLEKIAKYIMDISISND